MGKTVSKVNPQRKRVRFSKEFKLEAVRLLELENSTGSESFHISPVCISGPSPQ
jgi:hypothetical protein